MNVKDLRIKSWIKEYLISKKIINLTKIQELAIPPLLSNHNLVITSVTGSGKTYSYLIPVLNKLNISGSTQAIIVAPTKELVRQIYSILIDIQQKNTDLKIKLLVGDENIKSINSDIVVGTPSKILDFININKECRNTINTIVLDEVDMLIDHGFLNTTHKILSLINSKVQKIACSATTHTSLANSLSKYFKDTKIVSLHNNIWLNQQVKYYLVYSNNYDPQVTLINLLSTLKPFFCIIFTNTRAQAEAVYKFLLEQKIESVALLHKNIDIHKRKRIFNDVKQNKYQYLVATDLISRGIDIPGADVVISYGLPEENIWFMHRIGRVGRYKDTGKAFIIYNTNIANKVLSFENKGIHFTYLDVSNKNNVVEKPLKIQYKQNIRMFDSKTNSKIKQIYMQGKSTIKPGYKKAIKTKIDKIKQQLKHEHIEHIIKQQLIRKSIKRTKNT